MKLAIIGSRTANDTMLDIIINKIPRDCVEIISGGAIGIDSIAEKAAAILNIKTTIFRPDYNKYGKKAPIFRNKLIINHADKIFAFWDYKSSGTRCAILYAISKNKNFEIFMID